MVPGGNIVPLKHQKAQSTDINKEIREPKQLSAEDKAVGDAARPYCTVWT